MFALIQVRTRSSFTFFLRQPLLPALPATSTRELSHELSEKLRRKSTKARSSPRHGSLLYRTQSRTKRLYNALLHAAAVVVPCAWDSTLEKRAQARPNDGSQSQIGRGTRPAVQSYLREQLSLVCIIDTTMTYLQCDQAFGNNTGDTRYFSKNSQGANAGMIKNIFVKCAKTNQFLLTSFGNESLRSRQEKTQSSRKYQLRGHLLDPLEDKVD